MDATTLHQTSMMKGGECGILYLCSPFCYVSVKNEEELLVIALVWNVACSLFVRKIEKFFRIQKYLQKGQVESPVYIFVRYCLLLTFEYCVCIHVVGHGVNDQLKY